MSNLQTKEDKERFFSNLERLCESDSESEGEVTITNLNPRERLPQKGFRSQSSPQITNDNYNKNPSRTAQVPMKPRSEELRRFSKCLPAVDALVPSAQKKIELVKPKSDIPSVVIMKRHRPGESEASSNSVKKKVKGELRLVPEDKRIFQGLVFFFVPNDEIAKPRKIRIQRAREHGAQWVTVFSRNVTHVIVEPHIGYTEAAKAFPGHHIPEETIIVKTTWLSESLGGMYLRDTAQSRFNVEGAPLPVKAKETLEPGSPIAHRATASSRQASPSSDETQIVTNPPSDELERVMVQVRKTGLLPLESESEESTSFSSVVSETASGSMSHLEDEDVLREQSRGAVGFQCMEPNDGKNDDNPNSKTIAILQEMATYYDRTGDHWRTTAYRKAIAALRKQKTLIATAEQAFAIPQIGCRLADKIEEIVATNRLRRLESTKDDPHAELLQLFMGIYDVGHKQASLWIAQGHRTLSDLLASAKLSANQRIGVAHYDDFLQRIPRDEVAQHASIVQRACHAADKDLQLIIGGSYRRGNADSGDIDLIITKPDADMSHIRTLLTSHVIPSLTSSGFLKCTLVSPHATGSKWHGASCLPTSITWRRLDLLFVPWNELGAALLYFTGNDIFNRSMRLLASRKGMRLNQHGLYKDVMRGQGRAKVTEGMLVEGKSERKIFEILGVPWREPWERKC